MVGTLKFEQRCINISVITGEQCRQGYFAENAERRMTLSLSEE